MDNFTTAEKNLQKQFEQKSESIVTQCLIKSSCIYNHKTKESKRVEHWPLITPKQASKLSARMELI